MALQVWLPLNGNLNNQGLSAATPINHGATVAASGKIGSCYSFDGSDDYIDCGFGKDMSNKKLTITMWIKPQATLNDKFIMGCNNGSNQRLYIGVKNNTYNLAFGDFLWGRTTNATISTGRWDFLAITVDNYTATLYCNNIKVESVTKTAFTFPSNFYLGGRGDGHWANISMNDFRIYDECLSLTQLKEISKGLIAHYKLAPPGAANLERNTNCGTSGWTFNIGAYYTGTKEEVFWRGVRACKFSVAAGNTEATSKWRVLQHRVDSFSQTILKPATNYVISFDSSGDYADACSIQSGSGQNDLCNAGVKTVTRNKDGSYHYVYSITTYNESNAGWTANDQFIYIQYYVPIDGFGIVANLKLEEGTEDTPWCPNEQDAMYTQFNYNTLINEDSSGYLYDTITQGTLTWAGATNRYNGSVLFNGLNTNYIYRDRFDWLKPPFTFSCWCNQISRTSQKGSTGTATTQFIESQGRDCGLAGFSLVLANGVPRLYLGTETDGTYHQINSDTALALNTWHMLTGTYDGTTVKLYVDGVLKASKAVATAIDWSQAAGFTIGKMAYQHTTATDYFPFNGYINDVRVYATALSADDVSKLCRKGAYIDNKGYVGAYEFMEVE